MLLHPGATASRVIDATLLPATPTDATELVVSSAVAQRALSFLFDALAHASDVADGDSASDVRDGGLSVFADDATRVLVRTAFAAALGALARLHPSAFWPTRVDEHDGAEIYVGFEEHGAALQDVWSSSSPSAAAADGALGGEPMLSAPPSPKR